jgi:hypothetical protein
MAFTVGLLPRSKQDFLMAKLDITHHPFTATILKTLSKQRAGAPAFRVLCEGWGISAVAE